MVSASPLTRCRIMPAKTLRGYRGAPRCRVELDGCGTLQQAPGSTQRAPVFDLVAAVERYPEFVALCNSLKVRQRTPRPWHRNRSGRIIVQVGAGDVYQPGDPRPAELKSCGIFARPVQPYWNRWYFDRNRIQACDVGFFIAYEFKSRMLAMVMGCDVRHGLPALRSGLRETRGREPYGHRSRSSARSGLRFSWEKV